MSKKDDKLMASLLKKIMSGKVKEKEVESFLLLCFRNSSLAREVKVEPKVVFSSQLKERTVGEYKPGDSFIAINVSELNALAQRQDGAIWKILNTFGHETTHFKQYQRGDKREGVSPLAEESILNIYDLLNMDKLGGYDRGAFCKLVAYASYLSSKSEEEARQGGFYFGNEAFELLENNKYLKKSYQRALKSEREICEKEERDYEKEYREDYYKFLDDFRDICCYRSSFDCIVAVDKKNDAQNPISQEDLMSIMIISDIRVSSLDSKSVALDYLISTIEECGYIQRGYISAINGDGCSDEKSFEIKERITEGIIILNGKKDDMAEKCMNPLTAEFLEQEQVAKIYEHVLSDNMAHLNSIFFRRFLLVDKDNPRMLCETLINSYKEGNIKFENAQDYQEFQEHLKYLGENHMKDLSPELQKNFKNLSDSFGVKVDSNKNTFSV